MTGRTARRAIAACSVALSPLLVACSGSGSGPAPAGGALTVVAVENFWGSMAMQLGGTRVNVTSIVTDPNADPHEYETGAADARLLASASYVIQNGAGYDNWASRLLAAQPEAGRRVLDVASMLGKHDGDNPHFWYDPAYVFSVIDRITADFEVLDPAQTAYFAARHAAFEQDLAPYRERLAHIRQHFSGTPVAATESIFQYMAEYLGLDLVTPYPFMEAVAEGNDPPAPSVVTFEQQIRRGAFGVLVFNAQTVTPLTTSIREQAAQHNIRTVGFTETVQPAGATFEAWMDSQLDLLTAALNAAGPSA